MGHLYDKKAKYVLTIPTLVFVVVCVSYPMLYTINLSFYDWKMSANVAKEFIGLQNFMGFFQNL